MPKYLKPYKYIEKAYLHAQPEKESLIRFSKALVEMDEKLCLESKENENKTLFMNFLRDAFYGEDYIINELNNIDLTIAKTSKRDTPFVLIEAKRYGSNEMIDEEHFNRKSLRQLILYYLRQERSNRSICYLMITDYNKVYVFDKMNFLKLFYEDRSFRKKVLECSDQNYPTGTIYDDIIKDKINQIEERLEYSVLDIEKVRNVINDLSVADNIEGRCYEMYQSCSDARYLYKMLSEICLTKTQYQLDHNIMNYDFYKELLYIMGLREVIKKGTAYIEQLPKKERDANSLLEQAIRHIEDHSPSLKGNDIFENALDLVITWINRILFVKLLEAQLLKANIISKKFLTSDNIDSFNELEYLFVRVLGHKELSEEEAAAVRQNDWDSKFKEVPYLNSSLFDLTKQEKKYVTVDSLFNGGVKSVYKHTKLKDKGRRQNGRDRHVLDYILDFLDIYDFGVEATADTTHDTGKKPIINAAVLGRIFEKINGYKDGAFFTPSFISQYMCRDVIRKVVLERINAAMQWSCQDFDILQDMISRCDKEVRTKVNNIINNLTICDPAVGSGHFLVSALNEIIAIKYDLGVLRYWEENKRLNEYDITIENDELVIVDGEGDEFVYNPQNTASLRLQKSLYEEKRTIIQNCLFGVDLNNKSVEICRLRLWIELLKNIYRENKVLRTLPNIDINIKHGNSLLSRKPIYINRCNVSKDKENVEDFMALYKDTVQLYKNEDNKKRKALLAKKIDDIVTSRMPQKQLDLFGAPQTKGSVINDAYDKGIEWTVLFPEVLNDKGEFIGFDIIIGNPPYIALKNVKDDAKAYGEEKTDKKTRKTKKTYETFDADGDVYALFFELGLKLLKDGGTLSYITSNKWLRNQSAKVLRNYLASSSNPLRLINFRGMQLFHNATVETSILTLEKKQNEGQCLCFETTKSDYVNVKDNLGKLVANEKRNTVCEFTTDDNWAILDDFEKNMIAKMQQRGTMLKDWDEVKINRGILTGCNPVFVLNSSQQRQAILDKCTTEEERELTEEVIKPVIQGEDISMYNAKWNDKWIINTHNGIKDKTPPVDINKMPALKAYLDGNYDKFASRTDQGVTPYNLRDCDFLEDLARDKIVWGELSDKPKFAFGGNEIPLNTVFFLVGNDLMTILGQLNSKAILWYFHKYRCTYSGTGTARWLKYIVEKLPLIKELTGNFALKVQEISNNSDCDANSIMSEIDEMLYDAYGFTEEEKDYLRNYNYNI